VSNLPDPVPRVSSQVMYDEPAKCKEDHNTSPKDPLVLLRSPLNHTYGISTDTQCICNAIQPSLCSLQHLPLLTQIAQDRPAPIQKFIELVRRVLEERVLAQHVTFAVVFAALLGTSGICIGTIGSGRIVGLGRRERRMCSSGACVGQRVGILGSGRVVWTAT
jgi:hypothetical protein